jgi:hypothetical protein
MSENAALIDWNAFNQARSELGSDFVRILGYFKEDGVKSLDAIEAAMRNKSAAALVRPAHTLKGSTRHRTSLFPKSSSCARLSSRQWTLSTAKPIR